MPNRQPVVLTNANMSKPPSTMYSIVCSTLSDQPTPGTSFPGIDDPAKIRAQ